MSLMFWPVYIYIYIYFFFYFYSLLHIRHVIFELSLDVLQNSCSFRFTFTFFLAHSKLFQLSIRLDSYRRLLKVHTSEHE